MYEWHCYYYSNGWPIESFQTTEGVGAGFRELLQSFRPIHMPQRLTAPQVSEVLPGPTSPATVAAAAVDDDATPEGVTTEEALDLRSVKYSTQPAVLDIPKQVEISIGWTIQKSKIKHARVRRTKSEMSRPRQQQQSSSPCPNRQGLPGVFPRIRATSLSPRHRRKRMLWRTTRAMRPRPRCST